MPRDIYLQSRQQNRNPVLARHEKAFGIVASTVLLAGTLCAGVFLMFDLALPLLGRAWRTMPVYARQELVEACVLFAVMGAVLLCGWARAKKPRDLIAMALLAAIITPAFALGYSQVSDVWRSVFPVVLGW